MALQNTRSPFQARFGSPQSFHSACQYVPGQTYLPQTKPRVETGDSTGMNFKHGENDRPYCSQWCLPATRGDEHGCVMLTSTSNQSMYFVGDSLFYHDEAMSPPDGDVKPQQKNGDNSSSAVLTCQQGGPPSERFDNRDTTSTRTIPVVDLLPSTVNDNPILTRCTPFHNSSVDVRQFQDIAYEDWKHSSLEIDPNSPTSHSSGSPDTGTPRTDGSSTGAFANSFLDRTLCSLDSSFSGHPLTQALLDDGLGSQWIQLSPTTDVVQTGSSCDDTFCTDHLMPFKPFTQPRARPQPMLIPTVDLPDQQFACNPYRVPHEILLPASGLTASELSTSDDLINAEPPNRTPILVPRTVLDSDSSPESSSELEEGNVDEDYSTSTHACFPKPSDSLLIKLRTQGYSYRDIKRLGGFREAESTLRGRMRILTKPLSERVRRPEWKRRDVALLHRAVAEIANIRFDSYGHVQEVIGRVPWQRIAKWMKGQGSSYLFGAATCAKKWKEETGWRS